MNAANAVATREESAVAETTALLGMIERMVRDPTIDIARVERMFALRKEVEAEHARKAFLAALAVVQPKLPIIDRKGRIIIKEKGGEKIIQSTAYARWEDINEAITPIIAAEGFTLGFEPGNAADGKLTVTGILGHDMGHERRVTITLTHDSTGSKNAVQAVGSSLSYGKRYAAGLLLNITTRGEDDDGKAGGDDPASKITDEQRRTIQALIDETHSDIVKLCRFYKIEALADLPASSYADAISRLEARRKGPQA